MAEIKIGYAPSIEGAIGLAAVMRILGNNESNISFKDCDEDELIAGLESGELDIAVPVFSSADHSTIKLLTALYDEGAVLCGLGLKTSELKELNGKEVLVAEDVEEHWEELKAKDAELASLKASVVSFDEIISKSEDDSAHCFIFIPTPCDLIHLSTVKPDSTRSITKHKAYIAGAADIKEKVHSLTLDELTQLLVGNTVMSALMWAVECDGQEPEEAVASWQRGHLIGR